MVIEYVIAVGVVVVAILLATVLLWWQKHHAATNGKHTEHLEDALRDEKAKSSIILSAIEDGVILIDADRTIQSFNKGASEITGWAINEALTLDCDAVLRLEDDKSQPYTDDVNPFKRIFREKRPIHDNKAVLVTRSDKRLAISLSLSPLMSTDDKVDGAVAVFRDVSDSRAEEQRRAEFISTASHEMRTPVAAIEGYLALALNPKVSTVDERARGYLTKAHASTQHLGQLFQDLLTSAKAEDGRLSSHPTVLEMGSYLERLSEDLKFAAEKKQLFTEFTLGASNNVIDTRAGANVVKPLYYTYADQDRLREVVTNLFDNACKYTESGKISIGLTGNDDIVQFYIRDTGHGIPAEDVPHLFQKFYRVDNSSTRTIGGTGLGLFICRKIIELYNGHIWVESELGKGTTFFVNLPRLSTSKAEQLQKSQAGDTTLPEITSLATNVLQ